MQCWLAVLRRLPAPPTRLPCRPCPPADGSHFFLRRVIKFTLPLVPVALRTAPRWEVGAGRWEAEGPRWVPPTLPLRPT